MKKKIIVADVDKGIEQLSRTYCNPAKVTVGFHNKCAEVLPLIEIEGPTIVFLSLDLSDIDDFAVFDILKRCTGEGTPDIYIVYSDKSENLLTNIRKMKFKADGYMKKPLDKNDVADIVQRSFDSSYYLIPSDVTMKEILDDDDILDLGSVAEEVEKPEMDTEDLIIDNITVDMENSDPGTREDFKTDNIEKIEAGPVDDEVPELEDLPFKITDDDMQNEIAEMNNKLEKKEKAFLAEKKKLLRDIETSEILLKEKDEERLKLEKKMNDIQSDYEKRLDKLNDMYKGKLKDFREFLDKSLSDLDES